MLAREKPHWGVSGVPFMKSTTGAEPTALSMAWRVESESQRTAMLVGDDNNMGDFALTKEVVAAAAAGLENCAAAGRAACRSSVEESIGLANMIVVVVVAVEFEAAKKESRV